MDYNTFGRYVWSPEVPTLPSGDVLGSNTGDAGNFGVPGLAIDFITAAAFSPSANVADGKGTCSSPPPPEPA